jgi:signal transduction histidine kinase
LFRDNGEGIKDEDKEKVFEPFFTTKKNRKGVGIGLSIVKEIISQIGGTIKLDDESDSSIGTAFVIDIPVKNQGA